MTPIRSRLLRLVLPGAVLAAGAAVAGHAGAAELKTCHLRGLEHDAWCGVVKRPLDPSRPGGPFIDVHFAVVPAVARHKQPDPVFFFAGGPGQSAIDLAGPIAAQFARLLNRRDLVLVDQRGTGRSAPLKCDEGDRARPLSLALDPGSMALQLATCRAALQRLPHGDLRFYTTTVAMQDVDAVREALGVARLNAVGASYGTRAVLEYQRQFPQRVRRAVLDGVAPPDMVLPASFSVDNQAALDGMFAACERDAGCARRHPRLRERWRQLLASTPRTVTIAHPVTGRPERLRITREVLATMVRGPLYAPSLAAGLPQAIEDAADGRLEGLAALAGALQARGRAMSLAEGMHFSVLCSEDAPLLDGAADRPSPDFGDGFGRLYREACASWPRGEVPAAFRQLPQAASPMLLLSGGADPATPPRHAQRAAQALGEKARHVVVPEAGHGVMSLGCMADVVYRFIQAEDDEQATRVDASCAQRVPRPVAFVPVQPPPAAASAVEVPPVGRGGAR